MTVRLTQNILIFMLIFVVQTKASKSLVENKDENTKQLILELNDDSDLIKKLAKIVGVQVIFGVILHTAKVMITPLRIMTELGLFYFTGEFLHPIGRAFIRQHIIYLDKYVFSRRPVLLFVLVFLPLIILMTAILTYRAEDWIKLMFDFDILYFLLFTYFELSLCIVCLSCMLNNGYIFIFNIKGWLKKVKLVYRLVFKTANKIKKKQEKQTQINQKCRHIHWYSRTTVGWKKFIDVLRD